VEKKKKGKCKKGEVELLGLVLLIIGAVTICAFLLPSKVWLIILGGIMIFCGYKLFTA
jgi:1,4-dihydroxy-2-naphthoate octaprenyltransferase